MCVDKTDQLAKLYQLYCEECYLYAYYFTKNTIQAEDLVSHAFLAIIDSLPFLQQQQIKY